MSKQPLASWGECWQWQKEFAAQIARGGINNKERKTRIAQYRLSTHGTPTFLITADFAVAVAVAVGCVLDVENAVSVLVFEVGHLHHVHPHPSASP
jgi:hypothetical protein